MSEEQTALQANRPESSRPENALWRDEIQSRVAHYRSRRGRRVEGAFSMRFPFPPAEAQAPAPNDPEPDEVAVSEVGPAKPSESEHAEQRDESIVDLAAAAPATVTPAPAVQAAVADIEPSATTTSSADFALAEEPVAARPIPVARPAGKRKVIAFPRQVTQPEPPVHRLADPVVPEQPRILDVPEELEAFPTTPLLDGLDLLPGVQATPAIPADHVELPFEAATISRRVGAGVIDVAIVLAAAAAFAVVCYKMLPGLALSKPLMLAAASAPLLLWAAYQYMFVMYAGATPGMRMLHLRLSSFKGAGATWRQRRSRVFGLYFSAASLMMGLFWSLVDVDALCWHDRISRTYLSQHQ